MRCLTLAGAPPLRVTCAGKLCFVMLKTAVAVAGSKPTQPRTRVTQLLMDASPAVNGATITAFARSLSLQRTASASRLLVICVGAGPGAGVVGCCWGGGGCCRLVSLVHTQRRAGRGAQHYNPRAPPRLTYVPEWVFGIPPPEVRV